MKLRFSIVLFVLFALFSAQDRGLDRIDRVENGLILLDENKRTGTPAKLADRMKFYKVPGVSVAVISGGSLQ